MDRLRGSYNWAVEKPTQPDAEVLVYRADVDDTPRDNIRWVCVCVCAVLCVVCGRLVCPLEASRCWATRFSREAAETVAEWPFAVQMVR